MPKIAFVNTVRTGSHGRLVGDLERAAKAHGFETRVAFGRGNSMAENDIRIGSQADVLWHVAITRMFDAHGYGSKRATNEFLKKLQAFAPDIIHLHNAHGYYLHLETFFSYIRESRIRTFWTLHDCWAFTGHCSHFLSADCWRYQDGCHHCPLKKEYPASLCLDASGKNWQNKHTLLRGIDSLTIVCPSLWLQTVLEKSFLKELPRVVIPNGVDISLFAPKQDLSARDRIGIPDRQYLLLAVASPFDERKGFSDILRIAKIVDGKAWIVMIGLDQKQCAKLPPNVLGMPRTNGPEELISLYRAADCLINASREETYPTINMEAMACGTPVAAYAIGGCTEQIRPEVGRAVPYGDLEALADAALKLSATKSSLSAACRSHAEQCFDRKKAIAAYLSKYMQMERV